MKALTTCVIIGCVLGILLGFCVCPVDAAKWEGQRVEFVFSNDTNLKVVYWLYWIDHDLDRKTFPGPINLAGGELKPEKSNTLTYLYRPGKYRITWRVYPSDLEIDVFFEIKEGVKGLEIFPLRFEREGNRIEKMPRWQNDWVRHSCS